MTNESFVSNPYVGPRTFTYEERHLFFGREREARDLLARALSERLLLFYAQSGAGKSSLLHTQLIPQLKEKGFVVLPVSRVSGEPPAGVEQVDNIYAFNLMLSVDEGEAPGRLAHVTLSEFLARLARRTVVDAGGQERKGWVYDATLTSTVAATDPSVRRYALIIDQFEEIITRHPERWLEREGFFRQLNQAMQSDPALWVVLVLREDFVAALDPYASLMADRLRGRFYMERMGKDAALGAIHEPAGIGGRPFAAGVAEKLADDLSQVRIPGLKDTVPGQYVEPVQLQVVCYQLWENLRKETEGVSQSEASGLSSEANQSDQAIPQITFSDLAAAGDVDQALTQFYEATLAAALADPAAAGVSERQVRTWFDEDLITEAGTRGFVHQGETKTHDMPNDLVRVLQQRFVVRAETRGGDTWIELMHDRFVEPVRRSNRAWFSSNLRPMTTAAREWKAAGRPTSKLYTGTHLAEVQAQFAASPSDFDEIEAEFVRASSAESKRVRTRRRLALAGVVILLGILAALAWSATQVANSKAEQTAQIALTLSQDNANNLANRSTQLLSAYPRRSLLLALEAERVGTDYEPTFRSPAADVATHNALRAVGGTPLVGHTDKIVDAAFSPDGRWLATASLDGTAWLRDLTQPISRTQVLTREAQALSDLEFSPDSRYLATASMDGWVSVWSLHGSGVLSETVSVSDNPLTSITFSPDGRWIAASAQLPSFVEEPSVFLWNFATNAAAPLALPTGGTTVSNLRFSPDGQWLAGVKAATQQSSGTAYLWKVAEPAGNPSEVLGSPYIDSEGQSRNASVTAIAFSPRGRYLAVADDHGTTRLVGPDQNESDTSFVLADKSYQGDIRTVVFGPDEKKVVTTGNDGSARVWDLKEDSPHGTSAITLTILAGNEHPLTTAAIDATGSWLATGSDDGTAHVWRLPESSAAPLVLHGHERGIRALAFSPTMPQLLTASEDTTARLWDLQRPFSEPVVLRGFRDTVSDLAFSPDGQQLATASLDGSLLLWNLDQQGAEPITLHDDPFTPLRAVAFSQDGQWLGAAGDNGKVMLWPMAHKTLAPTILPAHDGIIYDLAFSSDGQLLAAAGEDGAVQLWDAGKDLENPVQVLQVSPEGLRAVAFSSDGQWLAIGGSSGDVQLRNHDNWQNIAFLLKGAQGRILAAAFSLDNSQLAAVGEDKVVRIWDVRHPSNEPLVLSGHDSKIGSVSYSPDGLLATGGYDQTTRLWDTSRVRTTPGVLTGHQGEVRVVSFSPDGRWLATGGVDRTVQLWGNSPEQLRQIACQLVGRNLSEEEWSLYFPATAYQSTCDNWSPKPEVFMATASDQPTRPAFVALEKANTARLRQYPRPPADNGRGLHFDLDLTDDSIARAVENLQSIDAKWTTIYAQDQQQALRAAKAAWDAGIMPVVRIGVQIDQPFDPVPWVEALLKEGIPPYIQIFNEPEDEREWSQGTKPEDWKDVFGRNWAQQAVRVYDAGGYPGIQVLDKETFVAAVNAVRDLGRTDLWEHAFFVQHNYGSNHPPAYPYDEQSQLDTPAISIEDDSSSVLSFLAYAKWMDESLGFVLPIIGGEGGWMYGSEDDRRYPKVDQALHAQHHVAMFDWFRTGILSNGEPLPDYLFSVSPWIESSRSFMGQNWWNNPLVPDGKLTQTIEAVKSIPPFVRRFSWD